jgi:hypothetical protein
MHLSESTAAVLQHAQNPDQSTISESRAADLQAFTLARRHIEQARSEGARTFGDLATVLNQSRIKAPSGRRWSAAAVARFLLP